MSGLQQVSRHLFDSGMYLESMKISPTARAGTVVANHACARRWLLTARPPKRKCQVRNRAAQRGSIEIELRGLCIGETAIRFRGEQNGCTTTNRVLRQRRHRQVDDLAKYPGGAGADESHDP